MSRYELSIAARDDMDGIWSYVAQHNVNAADRLISKLERAFVSIATHPSSGRMRSQLEGGFRTTVVGNYVIFYQPDARIVQIVRVLHGALDFTELFDS